MLEAIKKLKEFHSNEEGELKANLAMGVLFLIVAVGGYMLLKPKIQGMFNKAGGELDKVNSESY